MGVLNFSTDNLITGVNVIDGNLYWTDNRSEPKKLEIERFRDYNHENNQTTIGLNNVIESDLSVIRLHPFKALDLELEEYVQADVADQPEPPFEQIFPRFSYRWRYEDGQYSPYAPFTQAAFIPATRSLVSTGTRGEDNFMPNTNEANYIEGFNTTMYNNVGRIILNNIPRGPRDVVAIDLLYTESISSTIYTLETIDIPEGQRGFDYVVRPTYTGGAPVEPIYDELGELTNGATVSYDLLPLRYELSARKIYSALPANQLTRPYDEVPQRALAQEVTANRLIYANYITGFDQPLPLQLTSEFVTVDDFSTTVTTTTRPDGLHVKGNRTYEIGVAYIDPYGRQGAMTQVGTITNDDGSVVRQVPLTSDFHQLTREQIECTITSDPPPWADRYRYFIKDVSMDHHNLISYNIYNDGGSNDVDSEFIWIEFQSTDRNKVQAEDQTDQGTVLVLRRTNDAVAAEKVRFLVQDIQNEAPADVRNQLVDTITNVRIRRVGVTNHTQWSDQNVTSSNLTLRDTVDGVNFQTTLDVFNQYLTQWGLPRLVHDGREEFDIDLLDPMVDGESIDIRPLFITAGGNADTYYRVTSLSTSEAGDRNQLHIGIGLRYTVGDDGEIVETDVSGLINPGTTEYGADNITLYTDVVSDAAIERLGGRFWVRTARNGLSTVRSRFSFDGELQTLRQVWFETEPIVAESQLDLFWESSETFCVCTEHGYPNRLNWFNCIAEVQNGVYLETTRVFNKFNSVQLVKGVRVNVPTGRNEVIERPNTLTWSGIYNSRTDVNRLNEFITADGIQKQIEPNYGSIQKLHTRDTNLVVLAEDKVFNILADKDLLFNADGGGNVSAANAVLGQTTPYIGEYGIGKAPESFATYGYQAWFADPVRGVIIEFIPSTGGQAQLREISANGMSDFFRDRLFTTNVVHGMFNEYGDKYIVSMQGYNHTDAIIDPNDVLPNEDGNSTIGYELDVKGWPSRYSYIPEGGISLGNKFFTWKNGQMWMHNSNTAGRNQFYDEVNPAFVDMATTPDESERIRSQYNSHVQVIFNDNPSAVKEFLTLGWEGDNDWVVTNINTENFEEQINTLQLNQVTREGKHFIPIVSEVPNTYVMATQVQIDDENIVKYAGSDGNMYVGGLRTDGEPDVKLKSGIKGFYNNVTLTNSSTEARELFSINTENFISSN